jgi:hypothetical protein
VVILKTSINLLFRINIEVKFLEKNVSGNEIQNLSVGVNNIIVNRIQAVIIKKNEPDRNIDNRMESKEITIYCKNIINEKYEQGLKSTINHYGINEIKRIPFD